MTAQSQQTKFFFASQEDKDAAQRISDTVNLHLVAASDIFDVVHKWCVFALSNGESDGIVYDTKEEAVAAKRTYAKNYCYLQITPDGIRPADAWRFLVVNRHPMIDVTAPPHVINPALFPQMSNLTPAQKQAVRDHERNQRA